MRRVILALCIALPCSPALAEWQLVAPPVDHALLNIILTGRKTPEATEPTAIEWRALETLEAMAAATTAQERSERFTKAVMQPGAPPAAWFVLTVSDSRERCEDVRGLLATDPLWQGSPAMTDLMRERARLGYCVER